MGQVWPDCWLIVAAAEFQVPQTSGPKPQGFITDFRNLPYLVHEVPFFFKPIYFFNVASSSEIISEKSWT